MLNTHVDDLVDELIHGVHPRLQVVRLHIVVRILAELAGAGGHGSSRLEAAAEMSLLANSNDGSGP